MPLNLSEDETKARALLVSMSGTKGVASSQNFNEDRMTQMMATQNEAELEAGRRTNNKHNISVCTNDDGKNSDETSDDGSDDDEEEEED